MKRALSFGIDTSNYTTSAAGIGPAGEVFCAKRPLAVPSGNRGMRQSDALFCHTRDLPHVVETCLSQAGDDFRIAAVGVSDAPRRVEGSYMPCFLAGVNAARSAAALLGVPYFSFSHQEGHIEAARLGAAREGRVLKGDRFLAFHLSGGTTELLLVQEDGFRYRASLLFDTLDLTCGQLIDRCGVALGCSFPAGGELEQAALESRRRFSLKVPKKETGINLSGFENRFQKLREEGMAKSDLARFVFDAVISAVRTMLEAVGQEDLPVLFSGGVSSSRILREHFSGERFFFAPPSFSADNAIGIASLAGKGAGLG